MKHLHEEVFVCLDCETTGLDAKADRVIEVAVAKFSFGQVIDAYESLINPECPIPDASIAIHHIKPEMILNKPTIEQVLPNLLKLIDQHVIIGHGVEFDVQLLIQAAERHKIPCHLGTNRTIDTLRLARLYGESPVNSLESLRMHFNIENEGAHRAMSDVIVNREVFKRLCHRFNTIHQVFEALKKPIMMKVMPLGKHKGRPFKDVPLQYLQWMAHKEFDQDLLYTVRSELNRRKKGNLFGQATNPFSDL
jgi:DNA polymerase-3 subunit epsilon